MGRWTWHNRRDGRRDAGPSEIRKLQSIWTDVGPCRMHARASADSATSPRVPVVLVHGFGVSSSYFVPTAERLAVEFEVYAPDLPGHGKSDTPAEPLDIPRLADQLLAWMDAVGLQRVSLVANSMGCQVSVDLAVRYPNRVERLVLIGPTSDPTARTFTAHALRLIASAPFERVSLIPILMVDYLRMGPRLIPEFRFLLRDPVEEKLPQVTMPVMIVRGERDAIVPTRWFEEAARLVRAERKVVIVRWGHAVNFSAPRQLTAAIAPFLRDASLQAASRDCLTVPPAAT